MTEQADRWQDFRATRLDKLTVRFYIRHGPEASNEEMEPMAKNRIFRRR